MEPKGQRVQPALMVCKGLPAPAAPQECKGPRDRLALRVHQGQRDLQDQPEPQDRLEPTQDLRGRVDQRERKALQDPRASKA